MLLISGLFICNVITVIAEEMIDLECQSFSIEEKRKSLKQLERDDSRAE